jgi:TonB family protein
MRISASLLLGIAFLVSPQVVGALDDHVAPSVDLASQRAHPPRYPKGAVDEHQTGKLLLKVLVSLEGKPLSIEVEHASPPEAATIFGDAAKEAMLQWNYRPGHKGGKPYSGFVLVPLDFSLPSP